MNWTGLVRNSSSCVTQDARHVRLNYEKIKELAKSIPESVMPQEAEEHPLIPKDNLRDWVFLISLINFSFWPDEGNTFEVEYDCKKYRGYWAMCAIVKHLIDAGKSINNPKEWENKEKLKNWFLNVTCYIPMLEERVCVLKEAHDALRNINFDLSSLIQEDINSTLDKLLNLFPSLRYNRQKT